MRLTGKDIENYDRMSFDFYEMYSYLEDVVFSRERGVSLDDRYFKYIPSILNPLSRDYIGDCRVHTVEGSEEKLVVVVSYRPPEVPKKLPEYMIFHFVGAESEGAEKLSKNSSYEKRFYHPVRRVFHIDYNGVTEVDRG